MKNGKIFEFIEDIIKQAQNKLQKYRDEQGVNSYNAGVEVGTIESLNDVYIKLHKIDFYSKLESILEKIVNHQYYENSIFGKDLDADCNYVLGFIECGKSLEFISQEQYDMLIKKFDEIGEYSQFQQFRLFCEEIRK